MEPGVISHRRRMEACLAGELPDRTPIALWRHFPVDDQTAGGLAAATLHFQRQYDFDLVKVTPASSFCLRDWGVEDRWVGNWEGTRENTRRVIQQPEDWTKLRPLHPRQGSLGQQVEALRLIVSELGADTPVLQTVFNPLAQAKNLAGADRLLVHLRQFPDAVEAGLRVIAETTAAFIDAAAETGAAGIFYAVQHAQFGLLSEQEFNYFSVPYDRSLLEQANRMWLNMVHLHGQHVMFPQVAAYPAQVLNWHDRETPPDLASAAALFPGALCGGLSRWETMAVGTPEQVREEVRLAIGATGGRRLLVGTGCVLSVFTPHGNLVAARQAVEEGA